MWELILDWFDQVKKARTFPIVIIYILLIGILAQRLFVLQIVDGEKITQESEKKKEKIRYPKGTRGNIYDRNGVLLAYNELSYSVTLEDTDELKTSDEKNAMIHKLLQILKRNNCDIDIDFQIVLNKKGKFEFTIDDKALLNFKRDVYSVKYVDDLSKEQIAATAEDVFEFLRTSKDSNSPKFLISDDYTKEEALEIMAIRYEMFVNRYQYQAITIASNIDEKTRVSIKENSACLPGVEVTTDTYRKYNDCKYFSHIIGYTGPATEEELTEMGNEQAKKYAPEDQTGKTGIEKEYEKYLHGARGKQTITVNEKGRILDLKEDKDAGVGNDIYLTIDSELQKAAYDMLEKELASILLSKIHRGKGSGTKGHAADGITISEYEVYFALINNNVIDITTLNDASASDTEKALYNKFKTRRDAVLSKMEQVLSVNSSTTKTNLSDEYKEYQSCVYTYLSNEGIIINDKVDSSSAKYKAYKANNISLSEFIQYGIANGWVDLSVLNIGDDYYSSTELYQKLLKYTLKNIKDDKAFAKKIYYYMIDDGSISPNQLCVILYEQGVLPYSEDAVAKLSSGIVGAYDFIRTQISKLTITPAMLALNPCSGSVIVTDPENGSVLACVSYPGYNTNKYANKIDTNYYYKVYEDLSYPTLYRAVQQRTAPGSTYKPLVAIAALSEGYVSTGTKYPCRGAFSEVLDGKRPYCWYHAGHGDLNVSQAIANSCNCFFYRVGYDMSDNYTNNNKGLGILRKYAKMFGFDATSGISQAEYSPKISDLSAVYSAIGQGTNDYTPSQISRYATTLVNKENCYDLNLIGKIKNNTTGKSKSRSAKVHRKISLSSTIWSTVYSGMYGVVNGPNSSIDQYFKSLKEDGYEVAGKTGTAQENPYHPNHALFMSFAPYNNPKYCTTVVIPNGYASANAAEVASNVYKYLFAKSDKAKSKIVKQAGTLVGSSGIARAD